MARQTAGRQRKRSSKTSSKTSSRTTSKTTSKTSGARASSRGGRNSNAAQNVPRQAARQEPSRRNDRKQNGGARRGGARQAGNDAISLLKADHREVEGWFAEFEKTSSDERKADLARRICEALKAHTTIEEEIFYPEFLRATGDEDLHHEAEIEHEGAKRLIGEIESAGPDDDHFAARVSVLSEMIKHHVNEEEQRGGMFAKARKSDMDLKGLGRQLKSRKAELMGERMPDYPSRQGEMSGAARENRRDPAPQQR